MSKKTLSNNSLRAIFIAMIIGFFGCNNQGLNSSFTQSSGRENLPQVVATTRVLCDLAKQVGGNTINLTCLISPGEDPQRYQPKPSDSAAIEQANLILYNGYNLEPSLIKTIRNTKNRSIKVAVAQQAIPKPQQFRENGKIVVDPRIWHDPRNAMRIVDVISKNLGQLEPNNADLYANNAVQVKSTLSELDNWIRLRVRSIPANKRKLVTPQNTMGYYAKAYGLSLAGALQGINASGKPTSGQVNGLVRNIKQSKVSTIFTDTTTNPSLISSVGKEARVRVSERELYADDIGEPGTEGENYQKMMAANTRTIVEGLGGTYLKFEPRISSNR
jgi:manganese/iron transport system substrate-binding protein